MIALRRSSMIPQPSNNFLKTSKSLEVASQVTFSKLLSSGNTGNKRSAVLGNIFFKFNKNLWINKTLKNSGIIIFAVIGVFTSITITGNITEKRNEKILFTEPNNETIAEVVNLESRYTRGGWKIWAIFRYKTPANETYQKGIFNYNNKFKKGDKYYILYSVKYPEIIELEDKVE